MGGNARQRTHCERVPYGYSVSGVPGAKVVVPSVSRRMAIATLAEGLQSSVGV